MGVATLGLGEGVHEMSILFVSPNGEITEGHGRSRYFGTCGESRAWDVRRRTSDISLIFPSLRHPELAKDLARRGYTLSH